MADEVTVVSDDDSGEEVAEAVADAVEETAEAIEEVAETVADAIVDAVEAVADTQDDGDTDRFIALTERVTRVEDSLNTHIMDYQAHSPGLSPEAVEHIVEAVVDEHTEDEVVPDVEEVTIVEPDVEPEERRSFLSRLW